MYYQYYNPVIKKYSSIKTTNMTDYIFLFFASLIANTLSAFAGGGAGLVQLPVLIVMGLPFSIALATHKTATVALGVGALYRYISMKDASINLKFGLHILACGLPGTILGAYAIIQIPEYIAQTTLGILTIALGFYGLFKKEIGQTKIEKHRRITGHIIGGMILFLIGFFNGSLTSGSGLFVTMWLIIWYGLDYKSAVMYTLILVGLAWNGAGAISLHLMHKPIYWPWLPALLLGSLLGGYIGAHLGMLKGNKWIKYVFTSITFISGAMLLLKS